MPETQVDKPLVVPPAAQPGETVLVRMTELPPRSAFYIGFGSLGGNHEILIQVDSNETGELSISLPVPAWAERRVQSFFFVTYYDQRPFAFSAPMLITSEAGEFILSGTVMQESGSCLLLKGDGDEVYGLVGADPVPAEGSTVEVVGRLGFPDSCGSNLSVDVVRLRNR